MVSAFASETRLVLAQEKANEKSNEITVIPNLIDMLDVINTIITINAMDCQKKIPEKIVSAGSDYNIALKGNQNTPYKTVAKHFYKPFDMSHCKLIDVSQTKESNRRRIDRRTCLVGEALDELNFNDQWPRMKSYLLIKSKRTNDGQESTKNRFYISRLPANAALHNRLVHSHWAIENSFPWVMDMAFREDESRKRSGFGAENMSLTKHVALNKLQSVKSGYRKKLSLKGLRKKAGWDDKDYPGAIPLLAIEIK